MIALEAHAAGTLLPVKAQAGAKRAALVGEHAGALKVSVTAPREQGKANAALVEVLAAALGLRRSQIELVRGASGTSKRFLIRDVSPDELAGRIAQALARAAS